MYDKNLDNHSYKDITPNMVISAMRISPRSNHFTQKLLNLLFSGIESGQIDFDISKISYIKNSRKTMTLFNISETYLTTERFLSTYNLFMSWKPEYNLKSAIWDTKVKGVYVSMTPLKLAILRKDIGLFSVICNILNDLPNLPNRSNRLDVKKFISEHVQDQTIQSQMLDVLKSVKNGQTMRASILNNAEQIALDVLSSTFNIESTKTTLQERQPNFVDRFDILLPPAKKRKLNDSSEEQSPASESFSGNYSTSSVSSAPDFTYEIQL